MTGHETSELFNLMRRWELLTKDLTLPDNTRRVLKICLDDVRAVLAPELAADSLAAPPVQMPSEHPLERPHG